MSPLCTTNEEVRIAAYEQAVERLLQQREAAVEYLRADPDATEDEKIAHVDDCNTVVRHTIAMLARGVLGAPAREDATAIAQYERTWRRYRCALEKLDYGSAIRLAARLGDVEGLCVLRAEAPYYLAGPTADTVPAYTAQIDLAVRQLLPAEEREERDCRDRQDAARRDLARKLLEIAAHLDE
jgi:hypothetical protein